MQDFSNLLIKTAKPFFSSTFLKNESDRQETAKVQSEPPFENMPLPVTPILQDFTPASDNYLPAHINMFGRIINT